MSFQFIVLPVQFKNGGIARRAMHEKKNENENENLINHRYWGL